MNLNDSKELTVKNDIDAKIIKEKVPKSIAPMEITDLNRKEVDHAIKDLFGYEPQQNDASGFGFSNSKSPNSRDQLGIEIVHTEAEIHPLYRKASLYPQQGIQ